MSIVKTCYYCRRESCWSELHGQSGPLQTINYFEGIGWICEDCEAEKEGAGEVPRYDKPKWRFDPKSDGSEEAEI